MPFGKYSFEYRDKEFQDTPSARRCHLQGLQHLRAKAQWYDSFKDPSHAYTESLTKGVCNRFVKTGFCPYGDSCRYLHPKNNQQNMVTQGAPGLIDNNQSSTFQENQLVGGSSLPDVVVRDSTGMSWGNLPLSLMLLQRVDIHRFLLWTGDKSSMSFGCHLSSARATDTDPYLVPDFFRLI